MIEDKLDVAISDLQNDMIFNMNERWLQNLSNWLPELKRLRAENEKLKRVADWLAHKCVQACEHCTRANCAWPIKPMVSKVCERSFCYSTEKDWLEAARKALETNESSQSGNTNVRTPD